MATVAQIIDALGGTSAVASSLKLTPSTVHSWRQADFVPDWRRPALLTLSAAVGVDLSEEQFPARKPRPSKVPSQERAA
jgi:hypothetical protein